MAEEGNSSVPECKGTESSELEAEWWAEVRRNKCWGTTTELSGVRVDDSESGIVPHRVDAAGSGFDGQMQSFK